MLRSSLVSWRLGNTRCCVRTGCGVLINVDTFGEFLMLRRGVGCFQRKRKLIFGGLMFDKNLGKSSGANCISVSTPHLEILTVNWKFWFPPDLRFGPQAYRDIIMGQGVSQTRAFGVDEDKDSKGVSAEEENFKSSRHEEDANEDNATIHSGFNLEIDPVVQQEDSKLESPRGSRIDNLGPNPNVVENVNATVAAPEEELTRILDIKLETETVKDGAKDDSGDAVSDTIEKASTIEDELGEPPERPLPDDCCGQGCEPCVWDTYNDELRDYLARKKALQKGK